MTKLSIAAMLLAATPALAQQTGVAHPPETEIETSGTTSTSVPVVSAPVLVVPEAKTSSIPATAPSATATSDSPAVTLRRQDLQKFAPKADPDADIVSEASLYSPNEVGVGTMLRARLKTTIHTSSTEPGTPFRAEIAEPVLHDGRVIIPVGSVVEGRVTEVRGGTRFRGAAMIHLEARTIVFPDGSRMLVHASVVDTDQFANNKIDSEGNVVRKDHAKQTLGEIGLTTGGGAAAGGVIGGVPGALIGAGIGAGVGTVLWLKQDRQTELPAESLIVLALTEPLPIQPLVGEPNYSTQPTLVPRQAPVKQAPPAQTTPEPQAFVPTT